MSLYKEEIIVGVLGQWASGKSSAAAELLRHLGGESAAIFLSDRVTFASQAVNYILELDDSQVTSSFENDGRKRLDSGPVTVWLNPGEDFNTVDLNTLDFYIPNEFIPPWLNQARIDLGHRICQSLSDRKPVVIEAGFGQYPIDHTIYDLFLRLEQAGVNLGKVKWIIIEAGFDTRAERNAKRQASVPVEVFTKYAIDGGDLTPDQEKSLVDKGVSIIRIQNNHNDFEKFRNDTITAFEGLFGCISSKSSVG